MVKRKQYLPICLTSIGMIILILNTKASAAGIKAGIDLVLQSVIPSLFPLLFLSTILNNVLIGKSIPFLRPICNLCGILHGCEGLFLIGMIGGYPVGAQSIYCAVKDGTIDTKTAHRLLGFCSNAGPSFIFGMLSPLFSRHAAVWLLWLIHIGSALIVGILLPGKAVQSCEGKSPPPLTIPGALEQSIKTMVLISGWILLFRMLLSVLQTWIPVDPNNTWYVVIGGLLELSNGCCLLSSVVSEGLRFVLASVFLALGGVCVTLQTRSVVKGLGMGSYIPCKILQGCISAIAAIILYRIVTV